MVDVLEKILETRREALIRQKRGVSLRELETAIKNRNQPVSFSKKINVAGELSIIAEMKRKSPSAGEIRPDFDAATIARDYQQGGARAISVLTETIHFGGSLADLAEAKQAVPTIPALRKDFIFDPYQMAEARAAGADAILLIADMLEPVQLRDLTAAAKEYGVEPLVEVFTDASVDQALKCGAKTIGINTRNLRTLEMKPDNVAIIGPRIPKDRIVIAESGLKTKDDVRKVKSLGFVAAALVGESLLRQPNLEQAVRLLAEAGTS